ncbi:MAG: DUF4384 domain-containing protein [Hormoscilla sp. GUM202]|nr:DUF4384 domain-containing protein [Hormoscilla sp. GUM202]
MRKSLLGDSHPHVATKRWLRETVFPEWVSLTSSLENLWQELVKRARPTKEMRPVIANNLNMWSPYQDCVRLGSNIRFEVELGRAGHLLLLEKNTSGKVYCLCPSFLAPRSYLPNGKTVLPQEGAKVF